jgi:hypothetical protein
MWRCGPRTDEVASPWPPSRVRKSRTSDEPSQLLDGEFTQVGDQVRLGSRTRVQESRSAISKGLQRSADLLALIDRQRTDPLCQK